MNLKREIQYQYKFDYKLILELERLVIDYTEKAFDNADDLELEEID